jgi:predicted PurR-regulated permease PerM
METKVVKAIGLSLSLIIFILVAWYAISVLLLAFAAVLLGILLNTIGNATKAITHLPYKLALTLSLISSLGILIFTFWLYSPLIAEQTKLLMDQLPQATSQLRQHLTPYLGSSFLSADAIQHEFTLSNEKLFSNLFTVFSFTIGTIISFLLFLIIGFYFALSPKRYVQWILYLVSPKKQKFVWNIMEKIGLSLRWWLLGKLLSMAVIGVLAFIGLWALNVSLAFILGLLAALFAFIPYVGAILAAIPAILIAFAQSPVQAFYVTLLYVVIHIIEGYMITPSIEQKTVSIPPALTVLVQVLLFMLVGAIGLALATPITVVAVALIHYSYQSQTATSPHFSHFF